MRRFIFCFTIYISTLLCAKADRIIINGDTAYFSVKQSLLEQHPDIEQIRDLLIPYKNTPCYDCDPADYIAEWTVINNTLYLNAIYPYHISSPKADLKKIFRVSGSSVMADWVNAEFWVPVGKPLRTHDMWPVYGAETYLIIKNGRVIKQQEFKYPTVPRLTKEDIDAFIYSKIQWDKIPDMKDERHSLLISFESGATGKPENVRARRSTNCKECDEESLEALKKMPWPADYGQGKILPLQWVVSLIFSEEQRKKYAH